jgi:hypothetical protein
MVEDGWLQGPVEHWVEELVRLVEELRFDGFIELFVSELDASTRFYERALGSHVERSDEPGFT